MKVAIASEGLMSVSCPTWFVFNLLFHKGLFRKGFIDLFFYIVGVPKEPLKAKIKSQEQKEVDG